MTLRQNSGPSESSLDNYKALPIQTTWVYWSLGGTKEKGGWEVEEMVWGRTLGKGTESGLLSALVEMSPTLVPAPSYLASFSSLFLILLNSLGGNDSHNSQLGGHWREKGLQWQLLLCPQRNDHVPGSGCNWPSPFFSSPSSPSLPSQSSSLAWS